MLRLAVAVVGKRNCIRRAEKKGTADAAAGNEIRKAKSSSIRFGLFKPTKATAMYYRSRCHMSDIIFARLTETGGDSISRGVMVIWEAQRSR